MRVAADWKSDRSGAAAVLIALSLTVLIGAAGLATEAAGWYVKKRAMQGAADAAADAMVAVLNTTSDTSAATSEAYNVASDNGFTNGSGNVTVTPHWGTYNGSWGAQVSITQPQPLLLANLFMSSQPTIGVSSTAMAGTTSNAPTNGPGGSNTLVFNTSDVPPGEPTSGVYVTDVTNPSAIPPGTTISGSSSSGGTTTVTVTVPGSGNTSGVQTGDTIQFSSSTPGFTANANPPSNSGGDCLLVLSPSANNALLLNGTVNANLSCGVGVDSSSSQALLMNGTNSIAATNINVVGNVLKNPARNNATTCSNGGQCPATGASSVSDPYGVGADHEADVPSFTTCAGHVDSSHFPSGVTVNSTTTLQPGVYCGNILINASNITVTFSPGTYILDQASLVINGSPTVNGNGVTFVFTSSTGSNIKSLTVNGSPVVNFTAPSPGSGQPLPGFVFYQDRRASSSGSNVFNGATGSAIAGAMYFPAQSLTFNGTPSTSSCTQVISKTMTLNGTPSLQVTGCSAIGLAVIGTGARTASSSIRLVQ